MSFSTEFRILNSEFHPLNRFFCYLICALISLLPLSLAAENEPTYECELAVCAIFNNEAEWLKEWIEYHKIQGVSRFYLYNNHSNDDFMQVLLPYILTGEVLLKKWDNRPTTGTYYPWVFATQASAYMDAIQQTSGVVHWLAFIDIDEFIVPLKANNLLKFLKKYEDFAGVVINWSCYGPSHYWDIPEGKTMVECLTRKAPDDHGLCWVVKSIVQPAYVIDYDHPPHDFKFVQDKYAVDSNGNPYVKLQTLNLDKIKINHYYTRTFNYLYNVKIPKKTMMDGHPPEDKDIQKMIDEGNTQKDKQKAIFRFIPELRQRLGFE